MNENKGRGWLILGIIICILYAFVQCSLGPSESYVWMTDGHGGYTKYTVHTTY